MQGMKGDAGVPGKNGKPGPPVSILRFSLFLISVVCMKDTVCSEKHSIIFVKIMQRKEVFGSITR